MDIQRLMEMANQFDKDKTVWDTLGASEPEDKLEMYRPEARKLAPPKPRGPPSWYTTNSEYGRFQALEGVPGAAQRGAPDPCDGAPDPHDGAEHVTQPSRGHSGRSSGSSLQGSGDPASHEDPSQPKAFGRCVTGVKSPPIDAKYFPIQNGQLPVSDASTERKHLTTGVAKVYVMNACSGLWNNMQSVAEGAGFDVNRTRQSDRDAQVLTIDRASPDPLDAYDYNKDDYKDDYDGASPTPQSGVRQDLSSRGSPVPSY